MNHDETHQTRPAESETITTSEKNAVHAVPNNKNVNDDSNPQQGSGINKRGGGRSTPNGGRATMAESRNGTSHHERSRIPPTKKDSRKLFVGGLPSNVTEEEFHEFFAQFGDLVDSVVMFDRDTGRSRGFGFVTFEDPVVSRGLLTITENGKQVGRVTMRGKVCEIKAAEPKEGGGVRRGGNRHGSGHRSHRKQNPVQSPSPTANIGEVPPNVMAPAQAFPMDPVAFPPGTVTPGMPVSPWMYGPPVTPPMEDTAPAMIVPGGGYPPGVVVPGMYYPATVPPPAASYPHHVMYDSPYIGYPPQGVPMGVPPPQQAMVPGIIPSNIHITDPSHPSYNAYPVGPNEVGTMPVQNGAAPVPASVHDTENGTGTQPRETEKDGQA